MFKTTRLVILAPIISSAAATCAYPSLASGMTLGLYSYHSCKVHLGKDHRIYEEWELEEGFENHSCQSISFSPLDIFSIVFSSGGQLAAIELWTGKECDGDSYHHSGLVYSTCCFRSGLSILLYLLNAALPGQDYLENEVGSRLRLHSARICKRDSRRPDKKNHKPATHLTPVKGAVTKHVGNHKRPDEKPHPPAPHLTLVKGAVPTHAANHKLKENPHHPHHDPSGKKTTLLKSVEHVGDKVVKGLAGGLGGVATGWLGLGADLGAAAGVGAPAGEAVAAGVGFA
ncbi:hypothetical protein BJ138DRAFT_569908 [Hygrophoropsis aurantiaca]|uniref:Uncharacterized protein n=1 Tax=Hygrophoropsis aurantiaca TaxID=72124 RepID=A0ACB8AKI3_9AGAM|nr:hypothetical protein BJ138DRAFT_569908 [Hygrophoropsis aurantiaca]